MAAETCGDVASCKKVVVSHSIRTLLIPVRLMVGLQILDLAIGVRVTDGEYDGPIV